jgi:hypothetical protein
MIILKNNYSLRLRVFCTLLLVNWFTFHHLHSQDSHPSQVSGGLAGENPSNIVFEIGDLIGGKVISTIGGKYWNSQDEYPSTLFKPLKGSISNGTLFMSPFPL